MKRMRPSCVCLWIFHNIQYIRDVFVPSLYIPYKRYIKLGPAVTLAENSYMAVYVNVDLLLLRAFQNGSTLIDAIMLLMSIQADPCILNCEALRRAVRQRSHIAVNLLLQCNNYTRSDIKSVISSTPEHLHHIQAALSKKLLLLNRHGN